MQNTRTGSGIDFHTRQALCSSRGIVFLKRPSVTQRQNSTKIWFNVFFMKGTQNRDLGAILAAPGSELCSASLLFYSEAFTSGKLRGIVLLRGIVFLRGRGVGGAGRGGSGLICIYINVYTFIIILLLHFCFIYMHLLCMYMHLYAFIGRR